MHPLEEHLFLGGIEPLLRHHVLAVQRPPLDGQRRPQILADVRGQPFRSDEVQVVSRVSLVQRRRRQLVAAMVAQDALLLLRRESRVGDRHVEPALAVSLVGAGAVVRGERNHRPQEGGRRDDVERRVGDRREVFGGDELTSARHFPGVRGYQVVRARVIGTQPFGDVGPAGATVEAVGALLQVDLDLLLEPQAVAPQLRRGVAQRVLIMEEEVERILADREVIASCVEPAVQVAFELRQRGGRATGRGLEPLGLRRRAGRERCGDLVEQQAAALGHAPRRLHEHAHGIRERGAGVVHEGGNVFEPPHRGERLLLRRAIARDQEVVQATKQVREPELGVRRLRPQLLEAPHHHADLVEQGRAVDFVVQPVHAHVLERGPDRLQGGEVRRERLDAEAAVAIVVTGHARLRRGDGVQVPAEIEKRPLDVAEAHAFNRRWHSSSDSTRSVRLAASNSTLQAASFSES